MPEFSKAELKKLRWLAELACNRELNHDLHEVASACSDFRAGHIDELSLDELLRHYVEGTSTTVLARYRELEPEVSVARALAMGILESREVSPPLVKKLSKRVDVLRKVVG